MCVWRVVALSSFPRSGIGLLPVFIQQPGAAITQRQSCREDRIGTHESVTGATQVRRRISLKSAFPFVISPACRRLCGSICALRLLGAGKDFVLFCFFSFPSFLFHSFFLNMNISMHFLVVLPPAPPLAHPVLEL